MMTFEDLNLNKPLLNALEDMGLTHPTSIQGKVFSVMMSGKDVLGIAQTGTGKTFAYLLPCLRQWKYSRELLPQILILVPTRELVAQIVEETQKLAAYMDLRVVGIYGGTNIRTQMQDVRAGIDVLVATPGRLIDLVITNNLKIKSVTRLVIDEVDEMLDLGFRHQLVKIFDLLPPKRQNLMFSATMTTEVETLIAEHFNYPIKIEAAPTGTPLENINQSGYHLPNFNTKVNLLELLLSDAETMTKVLVFVSTKSLADKLFERVSPNFMNQLGVIHSNKTQNYRFNAVRSFQDGTHRILIATDIIARGLDIEGVSHVINFDTPDIPENYMHRIGRTGRADREGISITFIHETEREYQAEIEKLMNRPIPIRPLPEALEISDILNFDEIPVVPMKALTTVPKIDLQNSAFHERSDLRKKVNNKVTRVNQMKEKYGKPKTRGQKKRGSRK